MALDSFDRQLLDLLQRDASLSLSEMSEKVNLSRNAVWRRLARLEQAGFIRERVARLDPARLNLGLSVFIAIKTEQHSRAWLEQFRNAVMDLPEVLAVYRMTGDVDYLLQAMVPDMPAYDALYKRLIQRIELSDVSSSFVMEEIKNSTALPLTYV